MMFTQTHRDYDGHSSHHSWCVERAKGLGYYPAQSYDEKRKRFVQTAPRLAGNIIIIPCSRAVTTRIKNFLETQHLMAPYNHDPYLQDTLGPYYFTIDMTGSRAFEGQDTRLSFMGGPDTAYAKKPSALSHSLKNFFKEISIGNKAKSRKDFGWNNPQGINFARYNCWTASQGLTQYIGGIDLSQIHPRFTYVYRASKARFAFNRLFNRLSGFTNILSSAPYETHYKAKNMIVARRADGGPFILYKGCSNLTDILQRPINDKGDSLESWLKQQKLFEPVAPAQQLHSQARPRIFGLIRS